MLNRPRSIFHYSNMTPRLSGQTSKFGVVFFVSKSLLGIERQKKLKKFAILTRKPRSHVRILIYQTWPIPRELLSGHQHSTGPVPSFWCQRLGFEVKGSRMFFASALSCISLMRSTKVPKTNECIFLGLQNNFLECCFCT